jgi:hypothetical protein
MRFYNTGTSFEHPPTSDRGVHEEVHSLKLRDGLIVEQVVTGRPSHLLFVAESLGVGV